MKTIKILAIDSEEIILKSIEKALKGDSNINYLVTLCNTALEGIKLIRNDTFDLVFLDFLLPGLNGSEVLRRIKNIYPLIPVIVMPGFTSGINFNLSENNNSVNETLNNVSGFLLKPFTTEELCSIVSHTLAIGKGS